MNILLNIKKIIIINKNKMNEVFHILFYQCDNCSSNEIRKRRRNTDRSLTPEPLIKKKTLFRLSKEGYLEGNFYFALKNKQKYFKLV